MGEETDWLKKRQVSAEHSLSVYAQCFLANAQSLRNKRADLEYVLASLEFELLMFTETFLTAGDPDSLLLSSASKDYYLFRCDRSSGRGGGVALFCRRHTNPVRLPVPSLFSKCECLAIDLHGALSYRIICTYRPPNSTADQSIQLYNLLHYFCDTDLPIVLVGDLNLPLIDWTRHHSPDTPVYSEFLDFVNAHSLVQRVSEPTRLQNVLDLVLCSDELLVSSVSVEPSFANSDHSAVCFKLLRQKAARIREPYKSMRNFRKADIVTAKLMLSTVDWSHSFENCATVSEAWDVFMKQMDEVFQQTVPYVRIGSLSHKKYPVTVSRLLAKKRRLYRRWKRIGSVESKQAYRAICLEGSSAIREWHAVREKEILRSANHTKFYRYVNEKRTLRSGVAPLTGSDGSIAVSDGQKAAVLNDQFSSVFTADDGRLPNVHCKANIGASLSNYVISSESVRKVLCKLPKKYENEPEGIPSAILQLLSYELAIPLARIFTLSLATGVLPQSWKVANITPVFKKGSASVPGNYRPVSITSSICRVFERILVDHMFFHLYAYRLISDEQYGFVRQRSTELQLLSCVNNWSKALDNRFSTDVVLVDFAKAFDSVSHEKLLYKLEKVYGICGNVLAWIRGFLLGRRQRVKVENSFSEYRPVLSGVPQGSVVGPVLFLLFINDIVDRFPSNVFLALLADDLKLYMSFRYAYERCVLQNSINNLGTWTRDNQLVIQPVKCYSLTIGDIEPPGYVIGNHALESRPVVKDLGIVVDQKLSFKEHVKSVVHKASYSSSVLFKSFLTNDLSALVLAYVSYVRPQLEYGCTVWSPLLHARSPLACLTSIDKLESVQRRFTRRLCKRCSLPDMPYQDRLSALGLEPLELRRLKLGLCMIFKILHGLIDTKVGEFFEYSTATSTRGHAFKLKYPSFVKDARRNCFAVSMVPIWNSLPDPVASSVSLCSFKRRLLSCNDYLLQYCVFHRNL